MERWANGTFGKVKLVKDKSSGRIFAMKIISKQKVIMYNQKEHVMSEKSLLAEIDHPFCIQASRARITRGPGARCRFAPIPNRSSCALPLPLLRACS